MNKQDYAALFNSMHPGFFNQEFLRNMPEGAVCEEMMLPLGAFDSDLYEKELDTNISFGYYEGDLEALKVAVAKVNESWVQYFGSSDHVYCGYIDGEIACFCHVSDMGEHVVNGLKLKIGGPGCVGTLPAYRNRGIGLTMVKNVTRILQKKGYDYSYIHFTGVASWYEKLGYETVIKWNRNGII